MTETELLRVERAGMRFGNVVALDDVSLILHAGRINCLLGGNGAGKSTLIRILSGVYQPTTGRILVDGREVVFASPRDARAAGIATVHQDLGLIPLMSAWRNFFLGAEPTRGVGPFRRIEIAHCRATTSKALTELGVELRDPDRAVGTMSGGERQVLAIARAIHFGARVLILDEPTAALGVTPTQLVLRAMQAARDRGIAVLFVTHNPAHAFEVGEEFVILRRGKVQAGYVRGEATREELVRGMG